MNAGCKQKALKFKIFLQALTSRATILPIVSSGLQLVSSGLSFAARPGVQLVSLSLLLAVFWNFFAEPPRAKANSVGLAVCQLMQMETADVCPLESIDRPLGRKIAQTKEAVIDATPVISWLQDEKPLKAVIVCVHGLGLHKESYEAFGKRMSEKGYAIYSMDVRGFGEFQEMPGDRKCHFDKCLQDVCEGLKVARSLHPGLPVFILGESMGGAIAMRVTEEHPELMDGLISSVPGAKRYGQTKSALKVGMKLLTGGKVNVADTVVNQSTENEELRKAWLSDKLARFTLTPGELIQFQHFMDNNEKNAHKITNTPVLMVQGDDDKLVKQSDNKSILDHIPAEDKLLVYVVGGEHLIFEEGQFKDDSIQMLDAWLSEHIKAKNLAVGPGK